MDKLALHEYLCNHNVVHAYKDGELQREIYTKGLKQMALPYSDELQVFDPLFAIMACDYFEIPLPKELEEHASKMI